MSKENEGIPTGYYSYKGNMYCLMSVPMVKHPINRKWVQGVLYVSIGDNPSDGGMYVRSMSEFKERFKHEPDYKCNVEK